VVEVLGPGLFGDLVVLFRALNAQPGLSTALIQGQQAYAAYAAAFAASLYRFLSLKVVRSRFLICYLPLLFLPWSFPGLSRVLSVEPRMKQEIVE
jgi:hypothetical protein